MRLRNTSDAPAHEVAVSLTGRIRDNGAYVRLLWSGKSQSAVMLSASFASFRAIVAAIGGSDVSSAFLV